MILFYLMIGAMILYLLYALVDTLKIFTEKGGGDKDVD